MKRELRLYSHIKDIDALQWDGLLGEEGSFFLEWHWLNHLENTENVCTKTGWQALHITLWDSGKLRAALPLYLKFSSQGEFAPDYIWQEYAQNSGLPYLPKLVGMSPLSPVPAFRFLIANDDPNQEEIYEELFRALDYVQKEVGAGVLHFNYVDTSMHTILQKKGFSPWIHQGYEWCNRNYHSFAEYEALFHKNQRRNIRRERRALRDHNIICDINFACELTEEYLSQMFHFYSYTNDKFGPWAARYLNRAFFEQMPQQTQRKILLAHAHHRDDPHTILALSFFIYKNNTLYGRYWGSGQYVSSLHFELCYYLPIEWGITQGIKRFDPGIGAEHKTRRGFSAIPLYSFYRFSNEKMQQIFAKTIKQVNQSEQEYIRKLNTHIPFASFPLP